MFKLFSKNKSVIRKENARFTVITPGLLRLEYSRNGKFIDEKSMFAVNRDTGFTGFTKEEEDDLLVIDTQTLKMTYMPDGRPFSPDNLKITFMNGNKEAAWTPGMKSSGNLGGTIKTLDCVRDEVDLGEGLLSRDGWYLYDDSRNHLFQGGWVKARIDREKTDWYFFAYGIDYKSALKSLTAVSGFVPLPRKYALGVWYSRFWPYTSEEYRDIIREYKDKDFPLDVIVLDMDWHKDGWTGWSWNRKLLPDAEKLLEWFHQQGVHVTLNLHPAEGVGPHEDMYEDFMKEMGEGASEKKVIPFDAGDRKYLDALFKHTHVPLEEKGVDFWWLDWQQDECSKSIPDLANLKILNHYYFVHSKRNGKRGLSFSRWAGWGDHRYPIHFSGDSYTGWDMLKFEVPFTSVAGNMGCFFWSHDIGGHAGARNEESFVRWVQFGSTTAALRPHSNPEHDRRPWKYSKQSEDSMRASFRLRSVLFPYIYTSAWQCYRESVPLNRPMYIEYPGNEKSYNNPQQYLFGDSFLAAPITSKGMGPGKVAMQKVWFPEGVWYNWFTGEKYTGSAEEIVAADINEFPFFVKGGKPVPMQDYTSRMSSEKIKELIVRCYPGEEGREINSFLYEDDGVSDGYLKGEFAVTDMSYKKEGGRIYIKISPPAGKYNGQLTERSYVIELPCTLKYKSIDNNSFKVEYDAQNYINRIRVPSQGIGKGVSLRIDADEAPLEISRDKAFCRRAEGLLGKSCADLKQEDIVTVEFEKKAAPAVLEMLLALNGIGLDYSDTGGLRIFNSSAFVQENLFNVTVENLYPDKKTPVLSASVKVKGEQPVEGSRAAPLAQAELGFESVRAAQINFRVKGKNIIFSKTIEKKESKLNKWSILGPFYYDKNKKLSEQKYAPETEGVNFLGAYKDLDEKNIKWSELKEFYRGYIVVDKVVPWRYMLAYMVTYLLSEKEQDVTMELNRDMKCEVFLNNEKVFSTETTSFFDQEPDRISLKLKKGLNEVVIKFSRDWWAFCTFKAIVRSKYPLKDSYGKNLKTENMI